MTAVRHILAFIFIFKPSVYLSHLHFFRKKGAFIFIHAHGSFARVCIGHRACAVLAETGKRALDPLELELQEVVSCLGSKPRPEWKSSQCS